ncbi:RNA polymerase sigma factor [Staphylococcus chromogenes]|uniref:RNA polymerase sigma factor n=1 Tax=Staphylococcus chromogenes TaxID=46126 RepID=UPI003743B9F7
MSILSEATLATQIAPKTSFFSLELHYVFNQLSSKQRQWLVYHLQGYTQKEICERMCCALSTIKNYQRQTYAILKSNMSLRP